MSDRMPAIGIDGFAVERSRSPLRPRVLDRSSDPGRLLTAIERTRRRYETAIGRYREFSPRFESRVEHRIAGGASAHLSKLGLPFRYDTVHHEYRAPSHLALRWSWPKLPIWVTISQLSTRQSAIAVHLRSRRRWRYPRRYYAAAHAFLTAARSG